MGIRSVNQSSGILTPVAVLLLCCRQRHPFERDLVMEA
jgi:hypothetical protein